MVVNIEKSTEFCLFWFEAHGRDDGLFVVYLWFAVCDTCVSHLTRDLIPCLWCAATKTVVWVYIVVAAAVVLVLLFIVCIVCRCVVKRRSKVEKRRPHNEQTISGSKILKNLMPGHTASACCSRNPYKSSELKNHRATMGILSFERISHHRFSSALRVQHTLQISLNSCIHGLSEYLRETFRRILKWE